MYLVIERLKSGTYRWAVRETTGRLMAAGLPGFLTKVKARANFEQTKRVLVKYDADEHTQTPAERIRNRDRN